MSRYRSQGLRATIFASRVCGTLIRAKMQIKSSVSTPWAATTVRPVRLAGLPAPFSSTSKIHRAHHVELQKLLSPDRCSARTGRIMHATVKASAAVGGPTHAVASRPMNIVFVSAEVRCLSKLLAITLWSPVRRSDPQFEMSRLLLGARPEGWATLWAVYRSSSRRGGIVSLCHSSPRLNKAVPRHNVLAIDREYARGSSTLQLPCTTHSKSVRTGVYSIAPRYDQYRVSAFVIQASSSPQA